jgi:DNA-binding IclR family transcriptional regulator
LRLFAKGNFVRLLQSSTRGLDAQIYLRASSWPLKVDHPVGSLSPLRCTAPRNAFLAFAHAPMPSSFTSYVHCVARPIYDIHGTCPRVRADARRLAEPGRIALLESVA